MNMDSAPKDGTRILIKHYTRGYSSRTGASELTGTAISECRWETRSHDKPRWGVWCGDERTTSTEYIEALAWMPVPEELK